MGRGHTFKRENKTDLIGTYLCGSYIRDFDNFNINFGLYLTIYLRKELTFIMVVAMIIFFYFSLFEFGLNFVTLLRLFFV